MFGWQAHGKLNGKLFFMNAHIIILFGIPACDTDRSWLFNSGDSVRRYTEKLKPACLCFELFRASPKPANPMRPAGVGADCSWPLQSLAEFAQNRPTRNQESCGKVSGRLVAKRL